MPYLVDTNALIRFAQTDDPQNPLIVAAVEELIESGETLYMTPQNVVETYVTATRPQERNGFGMTPAQGDALLSRLESVFGLLPDDPAVLPLWRAQIREFGVSGVQSHDCRLVAFMRAHRVTNLLTLNGKDFRRYASLGIATTDPASVLSLIASVPGDDEEPS